MKPTIYTLIILLILSCKVQNQKFVTTKNNVSPIESKIIIDFLTAELEKDRYKYERNYRLVIIEEALKKQKSISTYEFNYKYKDSWGKFINEWILDSLQVKKIKEELENEEVYHWKESNFTNLKVSILRREELREIINKGKPLQNNLIIYLSRPLIINKKNAFISFDIGNGDFGYGAITHFTVLMRKANDKWVESAHYYDGVFD